MTTAQFWFMWLLALGILAPVLVYFVVCWREWRRIWWEENYPLREVREILADMKAIEESAPRAWIQEVLVDRWGNQVLPPLPPPRPPDPEMIDL